jgi:hypothetical protein
MATFTEEVNAGELITAELMNEILQRLAALEGAIVIPTEKITVPNVVGQKLATARAIILAPSSQLNLGFVIDAAGKAVDVVALDTRDLIVINQVPPGGTKVPAGIATNLIVAASSGGTIAPTPKPKITAFKPAKVPAGQQVEVLGENFALSRFQNEVFFNNVRAATPSSASSTTSLFVVIPKTIPNTPTGTGELVVDVRVVTPNGEFILQDGLAVLATLAGPDLAIASINPSQVTTNSDITITGSGFVADPAKNVVEFFVTGGAVRPMKPKSATAQTIVVTVPDNIVGVTAGGSGVPVNVQVNIKDTELRTPAKTIIVEVIKPDL